MAERSKVFHALNVGAAELGGSGEENEDLVRLVIEHGASEAERWGDELPQGYQLDAARALRRAADRLRRRYSEE